MWVIILLSLLLTVLIFLIQTKVLAKRDLNQIRQPPGPPRIPIIGNIHQLGSLPHQSLWRLSRKYGPVMLLRLGEVPLIVVSSAEAASEVLKTHDAECCSRPSLSGPAKLSYNSLDISFSPYGQHWREVRKVCALKLFTTKRVESFRSVREEEIRSLMDLLYRSSLSSSPVDLSEKTMALTASVTFRIAFGKCFGGSVLDNERFQEIIRRSVKVLGSFAASDFFRSSGWIVDRVTGFRSRLGRIFCELDDFYERMIDEHLDRMVLEEQEDLVDLLLKIQREQSESGQEGLFSTRESIKAILMDVFLAGVDTGAIVLTWAMAELARNPRAMNKAKSEARSYAGASEGKLAVSESDIHQLQYLKMVLKETMRLHPPLPLLLPRETISPFSLAGYEIPPKTLIQVNVWAIGRDPNYWVNPEEFFPERFANSSIDYKGNHFELLPFGSGRRGCPGILMGIATVELALANLLCCFDWKLPDGMKETDIDMQEEAGLTMYKKYALRLVPISYHWPLNLDIS